MTDSQLWIGLLTLTILEIVLGIDNIVIISLLTARLPRDQQPRARQVGLGLALITRILLLFSLSLVMGLTTPLFSILGRKITGRDLILIGGGLFLIAKSTREIHARLEDEEERASKRPRPSFAGVIGQILVLDVVFSLDSVITALGMVDRVGIMVAAVIIAVLVMLAFSGPISAFVERHPTVKMLALSFLLLIGANLIADGIGQHIPKAYTYFAMAFSLFVELLNLRARGRSAAAGPSR